MPDPSVTESEYQIVVGHFDAGRYEAMYYAADAFTRQNPGHAKGWHMLGLAALICGQPQIAQEALQRSSLLQPENPEVWDHLGTARNFLGDFPGARSCFERSLELDPRRAESWINAGKNLKDMGDLEAARAAYARAIELNPALVEAHNNLGVILLEQRRFEEALAVLDDAVRANHRYAWAHNNRGIALKELGRHEEALQACLRALELDPDNGKAWNNLGNVEHELGREEEALEAYRAALERAPQDPEVLNNLGTALAALKRPGEAAEAFREAVGLRPAYYEAWNNLGNALPDLNDKLAAFRRALSIEPMFPLGRSNLLFNLHYLPEVGPAELLSEAVAYGQAVSRLGTPRHAWSNTRDPDRPLRLGFVSADFCEHPVAYFLESVVAAIDRGGFELHAYYNERKEDDWTRRFRALIPRWRNIAGQADAAVAARIEDDAIDILVDLSGHTGGNRLPLFALRPAPIQVSWLGYWGTTGVPGMNYLLADRWGVPAEEDGQFSETVWRLPETRLCFTPPPRLPIGPVPSAGDGAICFGCFNNFNKLNDRVLGVWARILDRLPQARLFLKNSRADHASARVELLRRMGDQGIAAERVLFEGSSPREEYLRAYDRVDVSLDPFPYPGGTTTVESLWMGVPVLTLAGNTLLSRQGEGLLRNAGLDEWVAADVQDYVDRATTLATDVQRLGDLRRDLRDRLAASPLLDAPRFCRHFETALREMWRRYLAGVA